MEPEALELLLASSSGREPVATGLLAVMSIAISLKRIADSLQSVTGHYYSDPKKPAFIRTSDVGD